MPDILYTVRYYRTSPEASPALVVEDSAGDVYLFGRDGLVCRFGSGYPLARLAPHLLRLGWRPSLADEPCHVGDLYLLLLGPLAA